MVKLEVINKGWELIRLITYLIGICFEGRILFFQGKRLVSIGKGLVSLIVVVAHQLAWDFREFPVLGKNNNWPNMPPVPLHHEITLLQSPGGRLPLQNIREINLLAKFWVTKIGWEESSDSSVILEVLCTVGAPLTATTKVQLLGGGSDGMKGHSFGRFFKGNSDSLGGRFEMIEYIQDWRYGGRQR